MSRPRILLMARTLRRDLPSYYVLKKIIEAKSGAAVVVCSQRSVFHYLRHWRPQALVYPCCGDTPQFARFAPRVQLFCYSGEGGEDASHYDERFFCTFPEYLDAVRRILVWGENTKRQLLDDAARAHQGRYRDVLENDKVRVVGHPRLDLARYFPGRAPRRSVGICTHFFTLNNFRGDSALNLSFGRADVTAALEFEVALLGMVTEASQAAALSITSRMFGCPAPVCSPVYRSMSSAWAGEAAEKASAAMAASRKAMRKRWRMAAEGRQRESVGAPDRRPARRWIMGMWCRPARVRQRPGARSRWRRSCCR